MFCPPASPVVAPDTINNHVKTCYEEQKNLHFYAPECGGRLVFMQSVCLCYYLTSGCIRLWRLTTIYYLYIFFILPYFRWWCHHSCGYLLIRHVCLGGETCLINNPETSFTVSQYVWTGLLTCVDGTPGNPWQWRVLLCFSGRHQQRHTVTGGPAAEGGAYVYIFASILKEQVR